MLLLLFSSVAVLRAGEPLFVPHGASSMGMAFAVTATPGHWNCFHNQALLMSVPASGFSASWENRFMMAALSSKAVSAVFAVKPAPLCLVATHYGNADYFRIFTGLGSAVNISDGISLGIQVDYITERGAGDYRDVSHLTFETGMICLLSPALTVGVHLFNPVSPLNNLPSSIDAGLHWKQSDNLFLTLAGSKVNSEPISINCGIGWNMLDRIVLRSGYMSSPSSFTFGIGFRSDRLEADAGFLLNGVTGMTSSLSVTWSIR